MSKGQVTITRIRAESDHEIWLFGGWRTLESYARVVIAELSKHVLHHARAQLEAVKKHYEKIPVISMLFLTYEEDAIKEYIRNMTIWGEELQKLL